MKRLTLFLMLAAIMTLTLNDVTSLNPDNKIINHIQK